MEGISRKHSFKFFYRLGSVLATKNEKKAILFQIVEETKRRFEGFALAIMDFYILYKNKIK